MRIDQAEYIVAQYGIWCRTATGVPRYKSPLLAMMRELGVYDSKVTCAIDDDTALQVDGFLAALQKDEPEIVKALMLRYVRGVSYRNMVMYGISRAEGYLRVQQGIASLASCFRVLAS
ncbi:antiterminator Q family protein [Pseudomonas sp. F1_0610]|uniref:antiterminator Q family protein n=1 Tax=Pseudomonas sp. F1_0610 TaxID=3114284 RepID=UPI0039C2EE4E